MQSYVQQIPQQESYQQRKFLVVSIAVGVAATVALTWAAGHLFQRADRALKTAVNTPIPQVAKTHAVPVTFVASGQAGTAGAKRQVVDLGTVVVTAPRDEVLAAQAEARRKGRLAQAAGAAVAGGGTAAAVTP